MALPPPVTLPVLWRTSYLHFNPLARRGASQHCLPWNGVATSSSPFKSHSRGDEDIAAPPQRRGEQTPPPTAAPHLRERSARGSSGIVTADPPIAFGVRAKTRPHEVDRLTISRIREGTSFKPCPFDRSRNQRCIPPEGGQIRLSVVPMDAVPMPSDKACLASTKLQLGQCHFCTLPQRSRQSVAWNKLEGR